MEHFVKAGVVVLATVGGLGVGVVLVLGSLVVKEIVKDFKGD